MLYHYTSAKLLEKIIASGKLLPSNAYGWRLLWATSAETIDLTPSYHHEPIVARFTLHDEDFEPWESVRSRYQQEEMRKEAERMEQATLNKYGEYGVDPRNWYVRYAALSADRWLRIDTRDQRWQPYASKTWRRRGKPQLGKMPWISEEVYEQWGINLGIDFDYMDRRAIGDYLADQRYRQQTEEED